MPYESALEVAFPVDHGDESRSLSYSRARKTRPDHPTIKQDLNTGHWSRANALDNLGRHLDAAKDWLKAGENSSKSLFTFFRSHQSRALAQGGNHREGTALAAELAKTDDKNPGTLLTLAGTYGYASEAAAKDSSLSDEKRKEMSETYFAEALRLLEKVAKSGYLQTSGGQSRLIRDTTLNPIRKRKECQGYFSTQPSLPE